MIFNCREPTYQNKLISGYHPIKNDEFNFLDITNDGLKLDSNARKNAIAFWSQLKEKARRIET